MFGMGRIMTALALPNKIGSLVRGLQVQDQRQAFTATLLATVSAVNNKAQFNLELEINDLWTRLYSIRDIPSSAPSVGSSSAIPLGTLLDVGDHPLQKAMEAALKALGTPTLR